ncbi:hypothetical protein [Streptomyces inhibens]|nr:hypothetical protein [Streptomyces inhibens]
MGVRQAPHRTAPHALHCTVADGDCGALWRAADGCLFKRHR